MQTILSSRGLAALAWVSTFAALWADAFGLFRENPAEFWFVFIFSFAIAAFAPITKLPK